MTARPTLGRCVAALSIAVLLPACGLTSSGDHAADTPQSVVAAAGWTRIAVTASYYVVANVLPGERMFTAAEVKKDRPQEGELILAGTGNALGPDVRHVEAHVYDKRTGLPLTSVKPTIVVLNQTTGDRVDVESTLMQDVNIGAPDVHYGNNVVVAGNSELRLVITVGNQEVTLDGHLD
ncbi:MAG: hypothetical protein QOE00_2055 [Ilumatobacteraceae bacterium]